MTALLQDYKGIKELFSTYGYCLEQWGLDRLFLGDGIRQEHMLFELWS